MELSGLTNHLSLNKSNFIPSKTSSFKLYFSKILIKSFGLTNYIQTQDKEKVKRVARKLRSGMVDVNGAGIAVDAPFGGFKHSGIGREAGEHGLEEFLEVKSVGGWNN